MSETQAQDRFADLPELDEVVVGSARTGAELLFVWTERFKAQAEVHDKLVARVQAGEDIETVREEAKSSNSYPICAEIEAGKITFRQLGEQMTHIMALRDIAEDALGRMQHELNTHFAEEIAEMQRRYEAKHGAGADPFAGGVREVA
jgi:hypothetical protein